MYKFPADASHRKVMAAFKELGFEIVRIGKHISMQRKNPDGTFTPLTIPNHRRYSKGTLRAIVNQVGLDRNQFLNTYYQL